MGRIFEALEHLASVDHEEVLDGYRRYESALETVLTPQQVQIYADYIQHIKVFRIFEEMTPQELATLPPKVQLIAIEIIGETEVSMENRRVAALMREYSEKEVTPDFSAI